MKKIIWVIIILVVIGSGYLIMRKTPGGGNTTPSESPNAQETYKNDDFGFSFAKPEGFEITQSEGEDGAVVIKAEAKGEEFNSLKFKYFQIYITGFDEGDNAIDESRIRQDIPDMPVTDPEGFTIRRGQSEPAGTPDGLPDSNTGSCSGVKFNSDNIDYDGSSYEAWFSCKGNLYQISGPADLKDTISGVMETWEFKI